eukprot:10428741-Karenia_brevis.AAC.1
MRMRMSSEVVKDKVGIPGVHSFNAAISFVLKDPKNVASEEALGFLKEAMGFWSWKMVAQEVPLCKVAK